MSWWNDIQFSHLTSDVAKARPADIRAVLASYQGRDIAKEFIERSKEHQRWIYFLSALVFVVLFYILILCFKAISWLMPESSTWLFFFSNEARVEYKLLPNPVFQPGAFITRTSMFVVLYCRRIQEQKQQGRSIWRRWLMNGWRTIVSMSSSYDKKHRVYTMRWNAHLFV